MVNIVTKGVTDNMNKKGFTLIELLGVITLIALLTLIILPNVVNSVRNSSLKVDDTTKELIYKASDLYISNHSSKFPNVRHNKYIIQINELINDGLLSSPIKLSNNKEIGDSLCVQVTYTDKYNYELKEECELMFVSKPNLFNGTLTPVRYDGSNWIVANPNEDWYNYENQEWANAVILKNNKTVGDIVNVDGFDSDVYAMYVWIPRYEYKIEGTYGKGGTEYITSDETDAIITPGEIEVNFIPENNTKPSNGYHINSAFTFGSTNLSGIWVGKFETSHETLSSSSDANNLGCSNENCERSDGLRILPNVQALRHNDNSNFFYASRSMGRSGNPFGIDSSVTDSHMIKNSEWGIVAYLSQSKYGKYGNSSYTGANKEVYINNSSNRYTGRSAGSAVSGYNASGTYTYNININGTGASTTGNIYGVYDMNGGCWERGMGNYNGYLGSSGFTTLPVAKYYDKYTTPTTPTACNGEICYGQATSETAHWYSDLTALKLLLDENRPWTGRSGGYSDSENAGIFYINEHSGAQTAGYSFRLVLTEP